MALSSWVKQLGILKAPRHKPGDRNYIGSKEHVRAQEIAKAKGEKADRASTKAYASGKIEDHENAITLHREAYKSMSADKTGMGIEARKHGTKIQDHQDEIAAQPLQAGVHVMFHGDSANEPAHGVVTKREGGSFDVKMDDGSHRVGQPIGLLGRTMSI